jgi:hypothetical protein
LTLAVNAGNAVLGEHVVQPLSVYIQSTGSDGYRVGAHNSPAAVGRRQRSGFDLERSCRRDQSSPFSFSRNNSTSKNMSVRLFRQPQAGQAAR